MTRYLIAPLHERMVGRRTSAYTRLLMKTQRFAPDQLRAWQREKLRALLVHADSHTLFYRRRFREAGVHPGEDDPTRVLTALPLLDKETIRTSLDDLLWRRAPGGLIRSETGGSTGEPLIFYVDRRRQAYDQAARIRSHRWFGVELGDRELYLWGSPIEWNRTNRIKRLRDAMFNHLLLNAFAMSPGHMERYLDRFDRFRPVCLFGYPSSIALWADYARSRRRRLNTARLKAVFVTGETCDAHQRQTIHDYFGVPVANGYGSRDGGFIAHECPLGGMHITAENVYLEVVDQRGRPVPAGESGEIVLTHLDAYAMPLIRYRTGDLGRLRAGRCACGRGLPLLDVLEGRVTDFLYLPDGTIKHALSIIYPLREMRGMRQFRVIQNRDHSLIVEVVADDRAEPITREAVAKRIRPVMGDTLPVDVRLMDRIGVSGSGKHRYVISHVRHKTDVAAAGGGTK